MQAPVSAEASPPLLSVIIPAHNEEQNLKATVEELAERLEAESIPHEVIVVNDNSVDGTQAVAEALVSKHPSTRIVTRSRLGGFGRAVRAGLEVFRGDFVAIVMADRSDDPGDVVRYYRKLEEGFDCVFGSRFRPGSSVSGYPRSKLVVNRVVNKAIQLLFWTRFNDLTNAFKAYRRDVVIECGPYSSSHFNLTIEMSLSALIRRYHIAEIPIHWYGRTWGATNMSILQMGRRYLSVLIKLLFERILIGDDILEERLAHQSGAADRLRSAELRLDRVEAELKDLRGAHPAREDPDAGS